MCLRKVYGQIGRSELGGNTGFLEKVGVEVPVSSKRYMNLFENVSSKLQ